MFDLPPMDSVSIPLFLQKRMPDDEDSDLNFINKPGEEFILAHSLHRDYRASEESGEQQVLPDAAVYLCRTGQKWSLTSTFSDSVSVPSLLLKVLYAKIVSNSSQQNSLVLSENFIDIVPLLGHGLQSNDPRLDISYLSCSMTELKSRVLPAILISQSLTKHSPVKSIFMRSTQVFFSRPLYC